ncbi:glycosyl hydrolase 108 family protein [Hoeflea sp. CAU 1731]
MANSDRFNTCHAITAKWEGGWSNHAADPGGKTMYGVTEATYQAWLEKRKLAAKPVRQLSYSEALRLYRDEHWHPTALKYNPVPGVDLAVCDAAVNSGVSRGLKWLKAGVGSSDHTVTERNICRKRLSFMQSLKIWKTFGKGWSNRVADIVQMSGRLQRVEERAGDVRERLKGIAQQQQNETLKRILQAVER